MRLALSEVCLHLVNSISTARDPVHHLSWIFLVPNWSWILLVPNRFWILLVLNWSWILDSPRAKLILDPGFSLCQIDPGSSLCQIDPGSWILFVPNWCEDCKTAMESSPSSEMAATDDPCRTRSSDSRGKKLANGQNIRPAGQEKERWHLINWSSSFLSNIYFSQKPKKYLPNSPTSLVSIRFLIGKPSKNKTKLRNKSSKFQNLGIGGSVFSGILFFQNWL